MLFSNRRIMEAINETLKKLQMRPDIPADARFELKVATLVLSHVAHVNSGDGNAMRDYAARTVELVDHLKGAVTRRAPAAQQIESLLDDVGTAASRVAGSTQHGNMLKQTFAELLAIIDGNLATITRLDPSSAQILLSGYTADLLKLHNRVTLLPSGTPNFAATTTTTAADSADAIDEGRVTDYFRQALHDASATASALVTLNGGFGKETTLFSVRSKSLDADLVMRRDPRIDPLAGIDCHTASKEYPLLLALHAHGFPVPEPLFFGDGSGPFQGRAFSIMRRVAGSIAGDSTGSIDQVPATLQRTLATVIAQLHSIGPLTELADHAAFPQSLWSRSAADNTYDYIECWYDLFRTAEHLPLPALHGVFNWLLNHVPANAARSSLVHGDVGFHNLMFDGDNLSAVLDWEFAHIGDPAEDIGYIRGVMGEQLNWHQFLVDYDAAGGTIPDEIRVRYFEIWSHARNAAASALFTSHFESGRFREIKYGVIVYHFVPHFLARLESLICAFEQDFGRSNSV